jgi:hypothetical protein
MPAWTDRERKPATIEDIMGDLRVDDLKTLAKKLGLPKTLTRKDQLSAALADYLNTNLKGALDQISRAGQLFLAEAAHHQGCFSPSVFAAKHQLASPRLWESSSKNISPLRLMIFEDRESGDICIPGELVPRLQALLDKPAAAAVKTVDAVPAVLTHPSYDKEQRPIQVYEGERVALVELRRVLSLVQAGKVRVQDKSGRPTDAATRLVAGSLIVPDFEVEPPAELRDEYTESAGAIRAHAWPVLVQQCGWGKPHGGVLALTKTGKELLGRVSPQAFRAGFQRFLGDDEFDEFNRINHIRGQSGKAKRFMTPPSERRKAICDSMHGWPVGSWIAFDEAFRFTAASDHDFLVTENSWSLYIAELQYGNLASADDELERQYLRAFLMESLATLGLVDIAYVYPHWLWPELSGSWGTDDMSFCGRYDGLLYVRLNPLGAYCLGLRSSYEPPVVPRQDLFKVLPNREVALSNGPLSPADRSTLDLFAKQKSEYVWALDAQQILLHVEGDGAVEDVGQFLRQNTSEEIPQTVDVFLSDLADKADAVQGVETAVLVEMKDAAIAARVAHDAQAGKLCRLAGQRHLAVAQKSLGAFRTALRRLGYVLPQ